VASTNTALPKKNITEHSNPERRTDERARHPKFREVFITTMTPEGTVS
jgi:hypothetical protein